MEQLNKVEIRGRVGNVRTSQVGNREVSHFSVATNTLYRNQEGTICEDVTWHNCTAWQSKKIPDLKVIRVGMAIEAHGRLKNNKYTGQDGVDRFSSEVNVYEIVLFPDDVQLKSENTL